MGRTTELNVSWLSDVSPDDLRRIVDALYRVHHLIGAMTDRDALLESIIVESKQVARAEASSLMLYDAAAHELYFQVAVGESGDQEALKRQVRLKPGQGIAGAAADLRVSINVPDAAQDPRVYRGADEASRFETRNLLAVPLLDHDKLIGVLEVVNKIDESCFSETDVHIMEMFGTFVATVVANANLIEENLRAARMAAIGQAVTGLSHYTKNIVTGMGGSVDLIDQALAQDNTDLLKRSWPIFRRSSERISHFVADMLSYSKPRQPMRQWCDIGDVLKEVLDTFWGMLVRKEVAVDVNTDDVRGKVCFDSHAMYRCLLNILMNAAEAVDPGSGRIRVFAETTDNGGLRIDIGDNGPGVPEENRARIFEPFFSTKGTHGTGLGLAVAHKIVVEHGGQIKVLKSVEGGALFQITLPPSTQPRE